MSNENEAETSDRKHVVRVTVENYHGLNASLVCVGHECGYPEVFSWDSAGAMESYHGEPIAFEIPAKITGCDEDSGIDWCRADVEDPAENNEREEKP